jgi:hypothetical protein
MTAGGLPLGGLVLGLVGGLVWCLVLLYLLDEGE